MVHAHYFLKQRAPTAVEWRRITRAVKRLFAITPMRSLSAGGFYQNKPLHGAMITYVEEINLKGELIQKPEIVRHSRMNVVQEMHGFFAIMFDGKDDLGEETFFLTNAGPEKDQEISPGIGACNTAGKPYDLMVCAALIVANHIAPDLLEIISDGGVDDWEPALSLVRIWDKSAFLPLTIDPNARCDPAPMSVEERMQQFTPVSQFVDTCSEPGLYF
ncbi:hypothetical protein [Marinobacter salicampi]|uniref:hypothetical protein n=1 Tax=Marinobacter salicampi TaxID=435907 RepID=UPI001408D900|nr:hypothetical protein [Marinobacter salicampi]